LITRGITIRAATGSAHHRRGRARGSPSGGRSGALEKLLGSISERQDELVADAIDLGERVYAEKPKAFERRMGAYWERWR
jgi:hypothetical protein